jgi:di/tricarboxylate transporter
VLPFRLPVRQTVLVAVLVLAALIAALAPGGLTGGEAGTLAIVLVTLGLWATALVPNYFAALLFFAVALIARLAVPNVVFSGFASAAVWLIISGFVIGSAIGVSGLGDRMARLIRPWLTTSYPRLIGGLMVTCMLLGFLMPSSTGRAVVMVPIGMALADACGFSKGSKGRIGIAVVLAIGCNMPSFAILTSNIPNMVLAGAVETIHGLHLGYTEYLVLHYPVLGLVKSAIIVWLVVKLFPAEIAPFEATAEAAPARPTDRGAQLRVAAVLLLTLLFWTTDSLHGINAAWIGIAAAVLLMTPGFGVVTPPAFRSTADFGLILFVAGALAVGAVVDASGLGRVVGAAITDRLPLQPGRDFVNFLSLTFLSFSTGMLTTVPSVPAVLTPLAGELAHLSGFSLPAVLMSDVVGFSTVLFPYQVGPLVVAMQLSGERIDHLLRVTVPLAVISLLALAPLDYLWWKLLGWI